MTNKTIKRKYVKECEWCGGTFITVDSCRKYCCKSCKAKGMEKKRNERGQICWRCKNAFGGCSWSKSFKPVEGWKAIPTIIKNQNKSTYNSYKILSCPKFVEG